MIKMKLRTFPIITFVTNAQLTTPCTPENLAKQISDGKTLYQLGQVLFQENWPVLPNNCDPKKAIADSINFLFEMVRFGTFVAFVC